jgi:lysozyme
MKFSKAGRSVIEDREGRVLRVYKDSRGYPTCGVGHLVTARDNLKLGQRISAELCDQMFAADSARMEVAVSQGLKVPVKQQQFDALGSIAYNIGIHGFLTSTFLRRINAGDTEARIRSAIMAWTKNPELVSRRRAEWQQFAGGPVVARIGK